MVSRFGKLLAVKHSSGCLFRHCGGYTEYIQFYGVQHFSASEISAKTEIKRREKIVIHSVSSSWVLIVHERNSSLKDNKNI